MPPKKNSKRNMQDSPDSSDGAVEIRSSRARQPKKPRHSDITDMEGAVRDASLGSDMHIGNAVPGAAMAATLQQNTDEPSMPSQPGDVQAVSMPER
jgi:hypothetical protein